MLAPFNRPIELKVNFRRIAQFQPLREAMPKKSGGVRERVHHFRVIGLRVARTDEHFGMSQIPADLDARNIHIFQARILNLAVEHYADLLPNAFTHAFGTVSRHLLTHFHLLIKLDLIALFQVIELFQRDPALVALRHFLNIFGETLE